MGSLWLLCGAHSRDAEAQGRPIRKATVIIQERAEGAWARVGKMAVVRES